MYTHDVRLILEVNYFYSKIMSIIPFLKIVFSDEDYFKTDLLNWKLN